ncbi:MAG: GNAT family N-acetyltransferase [Chitinophagaceae bacterium]
MEIRKLSKDDVDAFASLIHIFKDVFEVKAAMPGDAYLQNLLRNPDFMVFVVKQDELIVGGLTIYVLHHYYDTRPMAFIYDVAISSAFQRQGFGKALMAQVRSHCHAHGFAEIFVEAEADDPDAIEFYRRTKMHKEMAVVQFSDAMD